MADAGIVWALDAARKAGRLSRLPAGYAPVGLGRALDLLVRFACGESGRWEIALGDWDLGPRCRRVIVEGLDCVKALVGDQDEEGVLSVLNLVDLRDTDPDWHRKFLQPLSLRGWSAVPREHVKEMSEKRD